MPVRLVSPCDALSAYQASLRALVKRKLEDDASKPLLGLHVVVDAGNGSGGFYASFLESLGAWVEGSQFLEPDGAFPNHAADPESPEAMRALSEAVVKNEADLGVLFDADCGPRRHRSKRRAPRQQKPPHRPHRRDAALPTRRG